MQVDIEYYITIITINQFSLLSIVSEYMSRDVKLIYDYLCFIYIFILFGIYKLPIILLMDVYCIMHIIFTISFILQKIEK